MVELAGHSDYVPEALYPPSWNRSSNCPPLGGQFLLIYSISAFFIEDSINFGPRNGDERREAVRCRPFRVIVLETHGSKFCIAAHPESAHTVLANEWTFSRPP